MASMAETPTVVLPASRARGGFFTIYKKGQGVTVRVGTAIAAGLLGLLTAYLLVFKYLTIFLPESLGKDMRQTYALGGAAIFLALYAGVLWWFINRPRNAEFLIETDAEMRKVSWTSRKDLIGSTKVVVIFMLMMAVFLFFSDLFFGYLLYLLGVNLTNPFG